MDIIPSGTDSKTIGGKSAPNVRKMTDKIKYFEQR
jgi:hypothetical protein